MRYTVTLAWRNAIETATTTGSAPKSSENFVHCTKIFLIVAHEVSISRSCCSAAKASAGMAVKSSLAGCSPGPSAFAAAAAYATE
jgi:hypothetical protein